MNTYIRVALPVVVIACVLALAPRFIADSLKNSAGASSAPAVREIHLVAKNMTFYVDGDSTPNPTLTAKPGERIRLVLRNSDPGMSHDFVIQAWSVQTKLLKGKGEDRVEFTVPEARGSHPYSCTPHSEMMGGNIDVK